MVHGVGKLCEQYHWQSFIGTYSPLPPPPPNIPQTPMLYGVLSGDEVRVHPCCDDLLQLHPRISNILRYTLSRNTLVIYTESRNTFVLYTE